MTSSPVLDRHGPGPGQPGADGPVFVAGKKARPGRRPRALTAAATLIAAVLALPLVFLLVEASGSGAAADARLILRPLTGELLWNTVRLTVVVTALCAVIGTAAAWCVERTNVPGRTIWAVLVVVPLAIPDFVVSFGWASLWTWIHGFRGAVIVMTLAVYPLVYLPVAASLRSADPGQEEVARSLGSGRARTFVRITLGQARGAILGGCLLVAMVILAEYGAFEIVGYQTFTTEIFTEINVAFSLPAACALALVLVLLSLIVLGAEGKLRGRGRISRSGALAQRVTARHRLRKSRIPVLAGLTVLTGLSLGVPVGSAIYWMASGGRDSLTGVSMPMAALTTALYGLLSAGLATVMALPVAMLAVRHPGGARRFLERSTYLVLAMPGVVIALALSYFTERYLGGFGYQTAPLLILAYAIMFFPLALVGVKASLARAPVSLDEVARSLGQPRLAVLLRVTLRLTGPGLVAAFCLVFLSVITELTATLILIPTGVQTLASQFWVYETNLSYGQAAPFALVMIAVAAIPSWVLGRFFDRGAADPRMMT
jgi:iron(III) transport system permease protein